MAVCCRSGLSFTVTHTHTGVLLFGAVG